MLFFSPAYLLFVVLPSMLIAFWAQFKVSAAMNKYSRIPNKQGLSGAQAAEQILRYNGISGVTISTTHSFLGDHYDPVKHELCLSPKVYNGHSISAVGIAAHEAGHALQQAHAYAPLALRSAILPLAAVSNFAWPILILGIFMRQPMLINVGIIIFMFLVLLQCINLPVEYNASRRARQALIQYGIIDQDELNGVKDVLSAAALTYVAAALGSILQLLWLLGFRRS